MDQAPLALDELKSLQHVDFGTLLIEHDLTYPQAERVIYWIKNEMQRTTDEFLYQRQGDWQPRGVRPGSPGLIETRKFGRDNLRHLIRKTLHESIDKR